MFSSLLLVLLSTASFPITSYIPSESTPFKTDREISLIGQTDSLVHRDGSELKVSKSLSTLQLDKEKNANKVFLKSAVEKSSAQSMEVDSSIQGTLNEGDSILENDDSLYDSYEISLIAGKTYQFTLESSDFDTYLLLLDNSDQTIEENDDISLYETSGFSITNSELIVRPTVSGYYRIWANGYDADSRGNYKLSSRQFSAQEAIEMEAAKELYQIGNEHILLGQFTLASERLETALVLFTKLGVHSHEAKVFSRTMMLYTSRGFISRLSSLNYKYVDKYPLSGAEDSLVESLLLVQKYLNSKQYESAIEYFESLPEPSVNLNTPNWMYSVIPLMVTNAYIALGKFETAAMTIEEVFDFSQDLPIGKEREELQLMASMYMGLVLYMGGDSEQALSYFEKVLVELKKNPNYFYGNASESSYISYVAALSSNDLGKYEQALKYAEDAISFARKAEDLTLEGKGLAAQGETLWKLGELTKAQDKLFKALSFLDPRMAQNQNFTNGIDASSLDIVQVRHKTSQLLQTILIELGNPEKSLEVSERFWDYNYSLNLLSGQSVIENNIAKLENFEDIDLSNCQINSTEASDYFENFDEDLLEQRDGNFSLNAKYAFLSYVSNLYRRITSQCPEFRELEDFKALTDLLAGHRLQTEALSNRLNTTTGQRPLEAQTSLDDIKRIAKERQSTIVKYAFKTNNSLGRTVQKDPSTIYIWVIDPSGSIEFRQVNVPEDVSIKSLIVQGRRELGVRGRTESERGGGLANTAEFQGNTLEDLYTHLIKDIETLLPSDNNKKVNFIAGGELAAVPFAALKNDIGEYLIENHTILSSPSINTLDLISNRARDTRSEISFAATVVGDPVTSLLNGEPLFPLPYAKREAQQVAQLIGTVPVLGKEATQTALISKLQTSSIIHFAAHGLLDDSDDFGLLGTIALAPDDYSNGFLTASEIIDLRLMADLVVLSACDTGLGVATGDSIVGLSSAFIAAGASSVVSTLWSVPDAPTADLMTEFYRQLDNGQSSAHALREAMLITKKSHPEPKDWAAFQIIGEDYQLIR